MSSALLEEKINRSVKWTIEKWNTDQDGLTPTQQHKLGLAPQEVEEFEGNLALNAGLGELIDLLIGAGSPTAYNNANSHLVVGNSTTAAAATQTDMQGGSTQVKAMDSGYPSRSGQTATWKATYGSSEGNFAWEECGVKNGSGAVSSSVIMLNRKVLSMGTKGSGAVWTLQLDITWA